MPIYAIHSKGVVALPLQVQAKCFTAFLQSPGIPMLPDCSRTFDLIRAVPFLPESIRNKKNILEDMKELLKKRDSTGRKERLMRQRCQDAKK